MSLPLVALFASFALADSESATADRVRRLVEDVKAVSGEVQIDDGLPVVISLYDGNNPLKGKGGLNTTINDAWLAKLAGLTTVTTLNLSNCDVHAAGLRHVATMTGLQNLGLTLTPVADADLEPLAALAELHTLSLASTQCTGEGFRHLQGLKKLTNLNMHYTPANDAGMAAVAAAENLERLWVVHGHFTDAAGPSFAAHKNLRRLGIGSKEKGASGAIVAAIKNLSLVELELYDNQSTDEGVVHAAAIPTLRLLNAGYASTLTDAALEAVARMPALEEFKLAGAKITDAGLLKLADAKSLKKVVLGKMKGITPDGIAQLRVARPDVIVESP